MAGAYQYDTSGQSYFFLLTVLLLILVPASYSVLRGGAERSALRVPYPCPGWNDKAPEIKKAQGSRGGLQKSHVALALGWVAFAFVVQRASLQVAEGALYDPYKILGIAAGATEKQIKSFFKKAAIKYHPDKVHLLGNQTKEEASNHFVELTKAYKALTDEDIRKNFELFGHPDGKQEFSQGIALPSWLVESKNVLWVMGAYALVLGVMLPYLVGRWWYGARKVTKDGVLNSTASIFFRGLKEDITFPQLVDLLAAADEFALNPGLLKLRKNPNKAAVDEYARLVSTVRAGVDGKQGWEGYAAWSGSKKRARVLIAAHMLRIPIADKALLKEKHATISLALPLTTGLSSVALAYNWLSTTITILHLQQFLLQAVHPASSPLLQLPYVGPDVVEAAAKAGVASVADFGKLGAGDVEKIMRGAKDDEKRAAYEVAKHWPVVEIVSAKFQVIGEKVVTPGSIVSFTVKMRITPPGQHVNKPAPVPAPVTNGVVSHEGEDLVVGAESSIDELIGRRKDGEDGIDPTPLAHAPLFPKNRKPTWYIFIGDHKLNRVFVTPHKFTDMGDKHVRTVRMTFPAPPGPGLYTFQAYVMSDSFVGTDVQKDLRMKVEPPPADGAGLDDEDDISEPDEDTIAGQMALMKGQPVRRADDSDDDTSGTEEDEEEESSDSDSD
ncbi:hypothetical protein RQP46_009206 [Phenoliferia psychrophenolica]